MLQVLFLAIFCSLFGNQSPKLSALAKRKWPSLLKVMQNICLLFQCITKIQSCRKLFLMELLLKYSILYIF